MAGSADERTDGLVLVSYNIRGGRDLADRANIDRQLDLVRSLKPDVLALQEVDRDWARSGSIDQCEYFAAGLGMRAFYAPNLLGTWSSEARPAQYGVAVLWKGCARPGGGNALPGLPEREPRGFAWAQLQHDETPFIAISAHLGRHEVGRIWQIESLRDWLSRCNVPVVLAGDFNMQPGSPAYQSITQHLNDLTVGADLLTFPSDRPSQQIDYVFASHGVKALSARTVNVTDSDHVPVVLRIDL
ncbi:MAG: endonuclease/exonuclease/phosphatase family protein [Chloroflexi bacterium]|nr:endonuclease/exonuclease/phosphatase family protein [Chloroflexota bacterium]